MNLPERCVRSIKDRGAGFELRRGFCPQASRKPAVLVSFLGAAVSVFWRRVWGLRVSREPALGVARGRKGPGWPGFAQVGPRSLDSPWSSFVEAACPALCMLGSGPAGSSACLLFSGCPLRTHSRGLHHEFGPCKRLGARRVLRRRQSLCSQAGMSEERGWFQGYGLGICGSVVSLSRAERPGPAGPKLSRFPALGENGMTRPSVDP